jgi:outer membrane protein TolC
VQASLPPNPGFSVARLTRGDEVERDRGLHFNLARWLALPWTAPLEAQRLEQTQSEVAMSVLSLAADTRKAYVMALAAEASVRYQHQVMQAAEASAELARRMEQVGNFTKLQRAREQGFHADAALNLARAELAQNTSRERLIRLLGLSDEQTSFRLPERLPDLPATPQELPDVERVALAQRLDVQAARLATEQTAKQLGLTRSTRFVNVLEAGWVRNSSNEAPTQRGWELSFELPLFDGGAARVARAQAVYRQSLHRAAEAATNARSEVRAAHATYRSAYDIARRQRDEIVPLRQQIAEENLLRYNGMLIGVFELLADARAQIAGVNAALDALRDFWLAQAELDIALLGRPGPGGITPLSMVPAAAEAGAAAH